MPHPQFRALRHTGFFALALLACMTSGPARAQDGWQAALRQAPVLTMPVGVCAPSPLPLLKADPEAFTWKNPLPQGDHLLGVTGGAKTIWAVGDKGRILQKKGRTWESVNTGVTDYLSGAWAADDTHVFVTGYNGRVLYFDGRLWWDQPTGVSNDFNGIWGSAPNDVFTVGDRGVIFHWDGKCWMRQESGTDNLFFGVWGSSATDVWAVGGRGVVVHYDGSRWQPVDVGVQAHFVSVWGTGPDNVYIVGDGGTVVRKMGDTWRTDKPDTNALLRWVWGTANDDVWVAGDDGTLFHHNGAFWVRAASGTGQAIRGGWSERKKRVATLVGDNGTILSGTFEKGILPVIKGTHSDLLATDGDWAVGLNATILHSDRAGWTPVAPGPSGPVGHLMALGALADGRALVAGPDGVWVGDTAGWKSVPPPRVGVVKAIRTWGHAAVAVGSEGLVMAWNGDGWWPMQERIQGTLNGIGGASPNDFWVVGEEGIAYHYLNGQWSRAPTPGGEELAAISDSGVTVGALGVIYRWSGDSWRRLGQGGLSLMAVADGPQGATWTAGDFGTILKITGEQIETVPFTGQSLWGIKANGNGMRLVGDGGTIIEWQETQRRR